MHEAGHGLAGGFTHSFSGVDHVVTMIALGILSHYLGRRARWLLPQLLGLGMTTGGVLAAWGVALPGVEAIIAGFAMLLSATMSLGGRVAPRIAYILSAVVAVLNGHVHIAEIPADAGLLSYGIGFVCANGVLYECGAILQRVLAALRETVPTLLTPEYGQSDAAQRRRPLGHDGLREEHHFRRTSAVRAGPRPESNQTGACKTGTRQTAGL